MGEATKLAFTGERLIPDSEDGKFWLPLHFARYCFAGSLIKGQRVLDVACGTGYGTAMLAEAGAERVVGVDIDRDTIDYARRRYGDAPGVTFLRGSALELTKLPLGPIDFCVSFETVEHLEDPGLFLAEIHRVLVPGGQLLISTPDRYLYSPTNTDGRHPTNSFHRQEWTTAEFIPFMSRYFKLDSAYGQECLRQWQARIYHWTKRLVVGAGPPKGLVRSLLQIARRPPLDRLYRVAFGSEKLPPAGPSLPPRPCEASEPRVRVRTLSSREVPTYIVCHCRKRD